MEKSLLLENLSWIEAEAEFKKNPIAVIPLGARLKEHGHHLPLKNDWILAEYFAKRVFDACKVLMLPTLQHGFYPSFVEYPGSIHIGKETSKNYLLDFCHSLTRHGLKKIYILNTGISTLRVLKEVQDQLTSETIQFEYTDLRKVGKDVVEPLRQQSAGTHADEIETSMMLYIAPEIVKMQLAQKDIHPDRGPGGLTRDPGNDRGTYSPTGAWGDPTLATKEKGKKVVEAIVSEIIDFLNRW